MIAWARFIRSTEFVGRIVVSIAAQMLTTKRMIQAGRAIVMTIATKVGIRTKHIVIVARMGWIVIRMMIMTTALIVSSVIVAVGRKETNYSAICCWCHSAAGWTGVVLRRASYRTFWTNSWDVRSPRTWISTRKSTRMCATLLSSRDHCTWSGDRWLCRLFRADSALSWPGALSPWCTPLWCRSSWEPFSPVSLCLRIRWRSCRWGWFSSLWALAAAVRGVTGLWSGVCGLFYRRLSSEVFSCCYWRTMVHCHCVCRLRRSSSSTWRYWCRGYCVFSWKAKYNQN